MNRICHLALLLGVSLGLTAAENPPRPRLTGVAHLALFVRDLEASRAFYEQFLGYAEPFSLPDTNGGVPVTFIKINDRQYLELSPDQGAGGDRLNHLAIQTDDAGAMRAYLAARGVKVPDQVGQDRAGNPNFNVVDPDGHPVEIVQYAPGSRTTRDQGRFLPEDRISTRMRHVGIIVTNLDAAMSFYHGILGFQETWRGGRETNQLSWVNVRVPDGDDYVEFMLFKEPPPPDRRGTPHHLSLEVPDIEKAKAALEARAARTNYTRALEIRTGINRKRQMNLYDPDGTRVELMEPNTVDARPAGSPKP